MSKIVLIQGHFALPEEALKFLGKAREVKWNYKHSESVYSFTNDPVEVKIVDESFVLADDAAVADYYAQKAAPATVAPPCQNEKAEDNFLFASISAKPVVVKSVPPLREFVENFREGEVLDPNVPALDERSSMRGKA